MHLRSNTPLLRLLLPFICGIVGYIFFPVNYHFNTVYVFVLTTVFAVLVGISFYTSYKNLPWIGLLVSIILFFSGYQLTSLKTEINHASHFSKLHKDNLFTIIRIKEPIQIKSNHIKAIAEVKAVKTSKGWESTTGKILVYIKRDSLAAAINYGDLLIIRKKITTIFPPKNPGEFDYKKYLSYSNIYHQTFLKQHEWTNTSENTANALVSFSLQLKTQLLNILKSTGLNAHEYAVAAAILVGDENDLTEDITSAYSQTGVIHILSVSGLHVGLIYILVSWLLSFIQTKHLKWLNVPVLLASIWFYCLLTGLAPSALRAASVLSLVVIANHFSKTVNSLNLLAASAFILLCVNPYLLMQIGFQLSYLAVLGLIVIQPLCYKLITFENYLADKLWTICTASFSAQLITLPLCLYYFHQVPNYFLLANILTIPLASMIVYLGVAVCLFFKAGILFSIFSYPFKYALVAMNVIVFKIQQLPYSIINNVYVSFTDTLIIYALILMSTYFIVHKHIGYLITILFLIMLMSVSFIYQQHIHSSQQKIIVYHHPQKSLIDFIFKDSLAYVQKDINAKVAVAKSANKTIHARELLEIHFIKKMDVTTQTSFIRKHENYIQFMNKKILLLDKSFKSETYKTLAPKINYIIVSDDYKCNLSHVCKSFSPELIIFDASVKYRKLNRWKKQALKNNVPFYAVFDHGAWVLDL